MSVSSSTAVIQAFGQFGRLIRSHAWTVQITAPSEPTVRCQPTLLRAELRRDLWDPSVPAPMSGSPAFRAGISQGDVIGSAGGNQLSSPAALQTALERFHLGNSVRIGWADQSG